MGGMPAGGAPMAAPPTKTVPMKCLWTAQASLATGIPLLGVGLMLGTSRRREGGRNAAVLGVVLGALIIGLPTALIGVCGDMTALCNQVMRPTLIFAGGLAIVTGLGGLYKSQKLVE
jgi:hypothetical protein